MNPAATWLNALDSALLALENFEPATATPASLAQLNRASAALASLTQQFNLLPAGAQTALKPQLPSLLGRLHAATTRLDTAKNQTAAQLQNLRSQTAALSAYAATPRK